MKKSEELFRACCEEAEWLDQSAFKSYDNKLFNYLEVMFSEEQSIHDKLIERRPQNALNPDLLLLGNLQNEGCEKIMEKFNEMERRNKSFNYYIIELMTLHREFIANFSKTSEIID